MPKYDVSVTINFNTTVEAGNLKDAEQLANKSTFERIKAGIAKNLIDHDGVKFGVSRNREVESKLTSNQRRRLEKETNARANNA